MASLCAVPVVLQVQKFQAGEVVMTFEELLRQADSLVQEQENVNSMRLSEEYMKTMADWVPPKVIKRASIDMLLVIID
eukprot:6844343-Pyramimonas_sp.AAC.1